MLRGEVTAEQNGWSRGEGRRGGDQGTGEEAAHRYPGESAAAVAEGRAGPGCVGTGWTRLVVSGLCGHLVRKLGVSLRAPALWREPLRAGERSGAQILEPCFTPALILPLTPRDRGGRFPDFLVQALVGFSCSGRVRTAFVGTVLGGHLQPGRARVWCNVLLPLLPKSPHFINKGPRIFVLHWALQMVGEAVLSWRPVFWALGTAWSLWQPLASQGVS